MTNDKLLEVLGALDKKVEDLLLNIQELKEERDLLKQNLDEVTRHRDELSLQLNSSDSAKTEVKQRIQAILQKIEQMEA